MSSSLLISFGPNTFALFMSSRDHLLVTLVIVYSNRWELLSAAIPVVASSKGVVRMDYIQAIAHCRLANLAFNSRKRILVMRMRLKAACDASFTNVDERGAES